MKVMVDTATLWSQAINSLYSRMARTALGSAKQDWLEEWRTIGAQLPFDPECTPVNRLYWHQRYRKLVEREDSDYYSVFRFLQSEDSEFAELQRDLGLHMGLFAYWDIASNSIRYLYGPGDYQDSAARIDDDRKPAPHFLIKAFYESQTPLGAPGWHTEPPWHFARMAEAFYFSRKREGEAGHAREIAFVRILGDESGANRTEWERQLDVIYAPSGEIDACILYWLFRSLSSDDRAHLERWCRGLLEPGESGAEYPAYRFEFNLEDEAVERRRLRAKQGASEGGAEEWVIERHYWGQGRSRTAEQWLEALGLIWLGGRHEEFRIVTPRGRALVEWLETYLGAGQPPRPVRKGPAGDEWLLEEDERQRPQRGSFLRAVERRAGASLPRSAGLRHGRPDAEFLALIAAVQLLGGGPAEDAKTFGRRCRMNLHSHLILRSGTRYRGVIANLPRAWIVFPVLRVASAHLVESSGYMTGVSGEKVGGASTRNQAVGFFLGTMRDLDDAGALNPMFTESGQDLLLRRIASIRALIQPLAEIENREIFFYDIYAESKRKETEKQARAITNALMEADVDPEEAGSKTPMVVTIGKVLDILDTDRALSVSSKQISRFSIMNDLWRVLEGLTHTSREFERDPAAWWAKHEGDVKRRRTYLVSGWPRLQDAAEIETIDRLVGSIRRHVIAGDAASQWHATADAFRRSVRTGGEGADARTFLTHVFGRLVGIDCLNGLDRLPVQSKGCFRPTQWKEVVDRHLRCTGAELAPDPGRPGFWVRATGSLPSRDGLKDTGGYDRDLAAIFRGLSARFWLTSMIPAYFEPTFLESNTASGWQCLDMSSYLREAACRIDRAQCEERTGVPALESAGVRVHVHVRIEDLI